MRNEVGFSLSSSVFHKTTFLIAAYTNFFVIRMVCSATIYWQFFFMRLNIPQFTQFYLRAKQFVYSCSFCNAVNFVFTTWQKYLSCIYFPSKFKIQNSKFTTWHFTAISHLYPQLPRHRNHIATIDLMLVFLYKTKIIKLVSMKKIDGCVIIEIWLQ